ncbi:MAG TPA: hypothetical protein PKY82_16800 [Pyrinomonadaceae bacterium]|nr:hypothetical protein [Pyrinomonadaceae bacterium]
MIDSLQLWHKFVETQDAAILNELLAENVQFHSPFVWKPKDGKVITTVILTTVTQVFKEFRYVREILDEYNWALEFEAKIGDLTLRGVDLIQINEDGQIIDFEVMVRPANALQALGLEMSRRLEQQKT